MVAGREVKLWGGPMHGQTVALEPGRAIVKTMRPDPRVELTAAHGTDAVPIPVQVGYYTPVSGIVGEFEWDGWQL